MGMLPTASITDVKTLKGVEFPAFLNFRQLLVTGPPGCGKSSLIRRIGGWSEEGYIDLGIDKWWTAQSLSIRPREIHLGFPCHGHEQSLAVFDSVWVDTLPHPLPDFDRVRLPPPKRYFFSVDWNRRYAFEFLLPPADAIYQWRQERARKGTHHVDRQLSLELVTRQREVFCRIGQHMSDHGLLVYVREGLDGALRRFQHEGET